MECSGEDLQTLDADAYRHLLATHGADEDTLGVELDRFLESLLGVADTRSDLVPRPRLQGHAARRLQRPRALPNRNSG